MSVWLYNIVVIDMDDRMFWNLLFGFVKIGRNCSGSDAFYQMFGEMDNHIDFWESLWSWLTTSVS